MFKLLLKTTFFYLIFVNITFGQRSTIRLEINSIADDLIRSLDTKKFKGDLAIFDFVNIQNQVTQNGIYLADLLRKRVLQASQYQIKDENEVFTKKGSNFLKVISDMGNSVPKEALNQQNANRLDTATDALDLLNSNKDDSRKKYKIRGVKGLAYGKIREFEGEYELTIEVKSPKSELITIVTGIVSKNDQLANLNQNSIITNLENYDSKLRESTTLGAIQNDIKTYEKWHLKFDLIGCKKNGIEVNCKFKILSREKETEITVTKPKVIIINQKNSAEYQPFVLNISDKTHTWSVTKKLLSNSPVDANFSFKPGEPLEVINRLSITFYSPQTNYFELVMEDIFVE